MLFQMDDIFYYMGSEIVIMIIVSIVLSLIMIITQILVGAGTLKWGLEAVDGKDEGFGSRLGTVFVIFLINSFLPLIGLFIGWKFISSRHDLNYGESILAFMVYQLPMLIILLVISLIASGIITGIVFLILYV